MKRLTWLSLCLLGFTLCARPSPAQTHGNPGFDKMKTLVGEWEALRTRLDLRPDEVLAIGVRTARATFLPGAEKEALVEEMLRAAADCGVTG